MTIGYQWLPVLGAPAPALAAPTQVGTATTGAPVSSPVTVTLPATTSTNDCLVIGVFAVTGSGITITGSGAGATWVTVDNPRGAFDWAIVVGYGCSSGQTTCTLTISGGAIAVALYVCSQWSGFPASPSPVQGSNSGFTASGSSVTTGNVSYVANELIVGMGGTNNTSALTPTWSSGAANTRLGHVNSGTDYLALESFIASASAVTNLAEVGNGGGEYGAVVTVLQT